MTSPALAERYGAPPRGRRHLVVAAVVLLALVSAAWLTWVVVDQTRPEVTSALETYTIDSEHAATAVVVVSLASPDVRASCTLRAYATDHSVVGERRFDPAAAGAARQVHEVRTERRATSVEMLGCTSAGQNRPR